MTKLKAFKIFLSLAMSAQTFALAAEHDFRMIRVKEGFSEESPLAKFDNAWKNTFFLRNGVGGSGSVVFIKKENSFAYVGILTARHVLENAPHPIENLEIYKDFRVDQTPGTLKTSVLTKLNASYPVPFYSEQNDLALLIVKTSLADVQNITPLAFSDSCDLRSGDPLVLIGFPATHLRPVQNQKTPISNANWLGKRASSGVYIGNQSTVKNQIGIVFGTSVDAIVGDSGGPMLNQKAEIVGVLSGSYDSYQGNDDASAQQAHSFIVSCTDSKNFAHEQWDAFLNTLGTEI